MHYELPVADFIKFLLSCVDDRKTGIVLFFSGSANWGKIVINQGKIQSVRFQNAKGMDALPGIQELKVVQYNFRPEDTERLAISQDADIGNEKFFRYFGLSLNSLAPAIEKDNAHITVVDSKKGLPSETGRVKHAKVLIADDSAVARKAISKILTEVGYQVVEAHNGFEALGQLQNERPDILLLDLIMPGIDGYAVLKAIERTQGGERIPIIVLTSRDGLLDKLKGMTLSCEAYLTKPIESKTLLETVGKYVI
jgi:CheY-like chemotaxis protein